MVWFQCEDCGDDLKKPKLAAHFRSCSAYRLSCIDCGETFDQASVQGHTQCITEAAKYGPKDSEGKPLQTPNSKSDKPKPNSDVDINVGLSTRPPWICSLCNTTTTSKQTLLGHAEGKKHRAKARAFHAQNQPKSTDEPVPPKNNTESEEANGVINTDKSEEKNAKRKREEGQNGEVIQVEKEGSICELKKKKAEGENGDGESKEKKKSKIKWKKIISSTLKSNSEGIMKINKLKKQVIKSLRESGFTEDKDQLEDKLMNKINSSSRFVVEDKLVRLARKQ